MDGGATNFFPSSYPCGSVLPPPSYPCSRVGNIFSQHPVLHLHSGISLFMATDCNIHPRGSLVTIVTDGMDVV